VYLRSLRRLSSCTTRIPVRGGHGHLPDIENLTALGDAVLEMDGQKAAAAMFAKVVARFGDKAAVRQRIGRTYALSGVPELAIEEFQSAIANEMPSLLRPIAVTLATAGFSST
jgi:hypothetical protein